MTITSTNTRRDRIRRWAVHIPLAAAVVAGGVCAGIGTGTAAPTDNATSTNQYTWTVTNYTDDELTGGQFEKTEVVFGGAEASSVINFKKLLPGEEWCREPRPNFDRTKLHHGPCMVPRSMLEAARAENCRGALAQRLYFRS